MPQHSTSGLLVDSANFIKASENYFIITLSGNGLQVKIDFQMKVEMRYFAQFCAISTQSIKNGRMLHLLSFSFTAGLWDKHLPPILFSNRLCDGTCHFSHHASWSTSTKCFTDTNFSVKDAPLLVQYNMMVLWWSINVPIGRNSAPLTTGRKLLWVFAQDASGRRWPTGRWRGWWRARWGSCVSSHRGIPQP